MEKLSKLEILNETIAFYNADVNRRSKTEEGYCAFNGKNGTHCAIGRCMIPEIRKQGEKLIGNGLNFQTVALKNKLTTDTILEERYRGHELAFWKKLQGLHDSNVFWDNAGITAEGEIYANEICKLFNLKPLADA